MRAQLQKGSVLIGLGNTTRDVECWVWSHNGGMSGSGAGTSPPVRALRALPHMQQSWFCPWSHAPKAGVVRPWAPSLLRPYCSAWARHPLAQSLGFPASLQVLPLRSGLCGYEPVREAQGPAWGPPLSPWSPRTNAYAGLRDPEQRQPALPEAGHGGTAGMGGNPGARATAALTQTPGATHPRFGTWPVNHSVQQQLFPPHLSNQVMLPEVGPIQVTQVT